MKPTQLTLKQHVICKRDTIVKNREEPNHLKHQYYQAIHGLSAVERDEFLSYAKKVASRLEEQRWTTLQKDVNPNQRRAAFPADPE